MLGGTRTVLALYRIVISNYGRNIINLLQSKDCFKLTAFLGLNDNTRQVLGSQSQTYFNWTVQLQLIEIISTSVIYKERTWYWILFQN